jgi:large subunit ribosomal protein L33
MGEGRGPRAWRAFVAQLVERILGKDEVTGSSPVEGSISLPILFGGDPAEEGSTMPADKIVLACSECGRHNYVTTKNRQNTKAKLKIKKYCKADRRHTEHNETKLRD